MNNLNQIHQTDQQKLAHSSQKGNELLSSANQNLQSISETLASTEEGQKDISSKLDNLAQITLDKTSDDVVSKLDEVKGENVSSNEKLASIEKQASENADLMKTLIREVKSRSLPVELVGMEQIVIQGEQGADGEKGPAGPQGIKGEKGDRGPIGPKGPKGEKGSDARFFGPRGEKGEKGEDGYTPVKGVDYFDGLNGKDGTDGSPDTPNEIVEKISSLKGKDRLSYNFLKDLPELYDPSNNLGGHGGGGGTAILFQDEGVNITENPILKLNVTGSGGSLTYSGSGLATLNLSGGGGGTWGSITGTLSNQTDLQSALDLKAPLTSPTFATSVTGSYLTASEMLITNASKQIVSAPVATYPSLTELTYVKGVTSAIQTQFTAKLNLTGGTMTGNLLFTDNTYDIGASGATRPRTGYFGTSLIVAGTTITSSITVGTGNLIGVNTNNSSFYSTTDNGFRSAGNIYIVADTDNSGSESIIFGRGSAAFGSITTNWSINGSGHLMGGTDNTYDIGAVAATRPRTGYFATSLVTPLLTLGTGSITMTGSIAATGARVTKGWFTDIESTNMPTVGGTAILTSLTAPQFTTIELGAASDTTLARVSAGVVSIEGVNILMNGGALGTPSSGTLTNATGLPISGLTASTVTAIGVGSVELGHATDTTIARVSAGVISVEGVTVATSSNTLTLTNKTIGGAAISGALTGTGAYIPVTLLNSGTSATSSTFWRGDGTWATPAAGSPALAQYVVGATDNALVKTYYNAHMMFNLFSAPTSGGSPNFVNWERSSTEVFVHPVGAMCDFQGTGSEYMFVVSPAFYKAASTGIAFQDAKTYVFECFVKFNAATSTGDIGWGFASSSAAFSGNVYNSTTGDMIGFNVSAAGALYATQRKNGSGVTNTDISSGITITNWNNYRVEMNGTISTYYVNGVLKATINNLNYPAAGDAYFGFGRSNSALFTVTAPNLAIQLI